MSSSESDNSEYEDIREFFSDSDWKDLCSYEKSSYRNAKENYLQMQRCGLCPKPPSFMVRKPPPKRQQQPPRQAAVQSNKKVKRLHSDSDSSDDEKDLNWSPTQEKAKTLPQRPTSRKFAPPLPGRAAASGKENVPPAGSTSAASTRTESTRLEPSASAGVPAAPAAAPPAAATAAVPGTSVAPRYPKRAGTRKTYTEPDLQDDDDFLFCDDCQKEYEGDCPEHGPLQVVADTEVAVGHPERALLTVPRQLAVEDSKIPGAGRGVWTREAVSRRVRFGPYEGDIAPPDKETGYGWEIRREGKPTHCIDALDMASSNWMRFVNCARNLGEENLYPFQFKGHLYYRTVRDIPANTELLVWYGDSYGKELGIDPKAYKDPAVDKRVLSGAFPCGQCDVCFASPLLRAQHHRATRCSAEIRRRRACGGLGDGGVQPSGETAAAAGEQPRGGADQGAGDRAGSANRPYHCQTCGAGFFKSCNLRDHMRTHTGEKPYTCQTCDARFSRSTHLRQHMRKHTGEKPYTCQTCGAGFSISCNLRDHMRTHTGEKPYTCQTCGTGFTRSCDLRSHMRTHTGEKPYTCQTCGTGFSRSNCLRDHMRTHTGEKPYTCQTCGANFTQRSSLRGHLKKHTGEEPKNC